MPSLEELGISTATVQEMYERWKGGTPKSQLEREYLNRPQSHGKLFTQLVRDHLGIETERASAQSQKMHDLEQENVRLRALLNQHGIAVPPPPHR